MNSYDREIEEHIANFRSDVADSTKYITAILDKETGAIAFNRDNYNTLEECIGHIEEINIEYNMGLDNTELWDLIWELV